MIPTDRPSTVRIDLDAGHDRPRAAWVLEVQDDAGGRTTPIGEAPLLIGSKAGADLVIADPTVSAKHVELAVLGRGVAVSDRGSKNGTFIGAARVQQAWAASGAVITIGRSSIVCREMAPEEQEVVAAPLEGIAGASTAMRKIAAQVRRLAKYAAPVLVTGESGTGKELVARALHSEGPRAKAVFVPVNVAALPRELVESELFGHEKGAFTGASQRRLGAFAEARGGTLFLDEIGELPLLAQPKLLRALDGYEVRRVGGTGASQATEARVVAATNVALEAHVQEGAFRRDLFHRLEVFVVRIPPLRERRGDVGAIASELLRRMEGEYGHRKLSSPALAKLMSRDWPGNVRQLRNTLIRAVDLAGDRVVLEPADLEEGSAPEGGSPRRLTSDLARSLMTRHHGNMSAASRAAGVPRTTFRKLLEKAK